MVGWNGDENRHRVAGYGVKTRTGFHASGLPDEIISAEKIPRALKGEIVWNRSKIPVNFLSVKPKNVGSSVKMIDKSTGKEVSYITVMSQTLRKPMKNAETKTHTTRALAYNDEKRTVIHPDGQIIEVYDSGTNELIAVYKYAKNNKTNNPEMIQLEGFAKTSEFNITSKNIRDITDRDVIEVVGNASVMIPIPVDEESNKKLYKLWEHLYENNKVAYFNEVALKKGTIAYKGVLIPEKTRTGTYRLILKVGGVIEDAPVIRKI